MRCCWWLPSHSARGDNYGIIKIIFPYYSCCILAAILEDTTDLLNDLAIIIVVGRSVIFMHRIFGLTAHLRDLIDGINPQP